MSSRNDITGDDLTSKAATKSYREGWDRIFGSKKKVQKAQEAVTCLHCKADEAVLNDSCMYCNKNSDTRSG